MSLIDHKAEAVRNIEGLHDFQSEEGVTDAVMLTVAIEAQAHATLYAAEQQKRAADATERLAEQQRLANLIAQYGQIQSGPRSYKSAAFMDKLEPQIREGLHL